MSNKIEKFGGTLAVISYTPMVDNMLGLVAGLYPFFKKVRPIALYQGHDLPSAVDVINSQIPLRITNTVGVLDYHADAHPDEIVKVILDDLVKEVTGLIVVAGAEKTGSIFRVLHEKGTLQFPVQPGFALVIDEAGRQYKVVSDGSTKILPR